MEKQVILLSLQTGDDTSSIFTLIWFEKESSFASDTTLFLPQSPPPTLHSCYLYL